MKQRILPVIVAFISINIYGQSSISSNRQDYFNKYYALAIKEMNRSGVPASITLAQGALESGDGNSTLARQANNHFGIKCHNDWKGKTVKHDDDKKNECFRKYKSVEDSYKDHSDFLKDRQRYAFLFELDPTDYKSWAKGLKSAGYATNREYAKLLIRIIEDYDLQQYDLMALNKEPSRRSSRVVVVSSTQRQIMENNRVKYIITREGDTFKSLAAEFDKLEWKIPRYNDLSLSDSLKTGRMLYLQPKRRKAGVGNVTHIVKRGETLCDVSQLYAIKLEMLCELNHLSPGEDLAAGMVLQLRRVKKIKEPSSDRSEVNENPAGEETEDHIELEFDLGL